MTPITRRSLRAICKAMEPVWSHTAAVVNIAPPIRPVSHVGWDAVKKNDVEFCGTLDQVSREKPAIVIKGPVALCLRHRERTTPNQGRRDQRRSKFRDEHLRQRGWSLAHGVSPGCSHRAAAMTAGYFQNSRDARRAPSAMAANFANTTSGSTAACPTQVP